MDRRRRSRDAWRDRRRKVVVDGEEGRPKLRSLPSFDRSTMVRDGHWLRAWHRFRHLRLQRRRCDPLQSRRIERMLFLLLLQGRRSSLRCRTQLRSSRLKSDHCWGTLPDCYRFHCCYRTNVVVVVVGRSQGYSAWSTELPMELIAASPYYGDATAPTAASTCWIEHLI